MTVQLTAMCPTLGKIAIGGYALGICQHRITAIVELLRWSCSFGPGKLSAVLIEGEESLNT